LDKKDIEFNGLIELSPMPRFLIKGVGDGAMLCSYVNEKALEYFDIKREVFIQKSLKELINQSDFESIISAVQNVIEKNEIVSLRIGLYNDQDFDVFVFSKVEVLGEEFCEVLITPSIINDEMASQKAQEDAISLLTSVFDVSEVGIIVSDRKQRVVRINDSFHRIYGWSRDEIIGEEFASIVSPEERDFVKQRHREFMETGIRSSGEIKLLRKDGGVASVLFTTAVLELNYGRKFQVTTLMDISIRKKMEESLREAKEQADTANKAKSSFLANMSHELRTPLNAIIGFSEMMMSETFGKIGNAKYIEYLHDIHVSAEHLLGVINEVLDMSKIEAGRTELREEKIDVNEMLQGVTRMMASRAYSCGVEIKEEIPQDTPAIYADHRLLRQILINLIGNSIKFSKQDSVIEVSVNLNQKGGLSFFVKDQGVGIPKDKIQEALEPFAQLDKSMIGIQGTGLGLPLAKAMVELHGGEFLVESELDKGTVVEFSFPAKRVVLDDDADKVSPMSGFKKNKVHS
jgi:PAS domain S-box-containing protein